MGIFVRYLNNLYKNLISFNPLLNYILGLLFNFDSIFLNLARRRMVRIVRIVFVVIVLIFKLYYKC